MDVTERKSLRRLSRALLSSGYQAELGAAIADATGPVWGTNLIEQLDEAPGKGVISDELGRLRELALLIPDPNQSPHDRRSLFVPADPDGPYWRLCKQLRDQAQTH